MSVFYNGFGRKTNHPNRAKDVLVFKIYYFYYILVGVFGPPTSKFVFARLARMVCSEDTRVYTGSGGTSLLPICCLLPALGLK